MSDLLPCPFCGESDLVMSDRSPGHWRAILCNECGARGPSVKLEDEQIRDDWNIRAERDDLLKANAILHKLMDNREAETSALRKALEAYQQWEADIIMENECWSTQTCVLGLTQKLFDQMIELQTMRNAALTLPASGVDLTSSDRSAP